MSEEREGGGHKSQSGGGLAVISVLVSHIQAAILFQSPHVIFMRYCQPKPKRNYEFGGKGRGGGDKSND